MKNIISNKLYGSTPPFTYGKEKMDALFLGVLNAVSRCYTWIFCRESTGALYRKEQRNFQKPLSKICTTILPLSIARRSAELYIACVNSLLTLSKTKLEGNNAARFSLYTRFMYWTQPIIWSRATFEQIKNSGSLRYFKNYRLLEKMMNYEAIVKQIDMEAYNNTIRGNLLLK